jgi:hypothetical protein
VVGREFHFRGEVFQAHVGLPLLFVEIGAEAAVHDVEDGAGDVLRDFLDEAADDGGVGADDFAAIGGFLAGDETHEAGLARAIAAEETDAFAGLDLEIDFVEQGRGAVFEGDLAELEERHGSRGVSRNGAKFATVLGRVSRGGLKRGGKG